MQTQSDSGSLRGVIFDVDGTLVNSNDLHIEAWREAFRHYGKEVSFADVHAQMGKGGDQLLPVFLSEEEVERFGKELEAFRVELFVKDYLPRAEPFPRVRELFERLAADGLQVALATSAKEPELKQHKKKLRIDDLLDGTTSADDAEHSKPAPDIFEAALARLKGIAPDEAVVIGDSPFDVIAARRAGIRTIGLLSGGFKADELRAQGAIAVYRDIGELLDRYDDSPLAGAVSSQTA